MITSKHSRAELHTLDKHDRFIFFSRSSDAPCGRGPEEIGDPNNYPKLQKFKQFRKQLSNFCLCTITIDGLQFPSVEHFFHYSKARVVSEDLALRFVCGGMYSEIPSAQVKTRTNKRYLHFTADQLALWEDMRDEVLMSGWEAKFSQHSNLREMLVATYPAHLYHFVLTQKQPAAYERWHGLETVRQRLIAGTSDDGDVEEPCDDESKTTEFAL